MDNVVMLVYVVLSKRLSSSGLGKKKFPAQATIRRLSGEWGWLVISRCATLAVADSEAACSWLYVPRGPEKSYNSAWKPLEVNRGVDGSPQATQNPPEHPTAH